METVNELTAFLEPLLQDGFWNRLTERGEAWSTMRSHGQLPEYASNMGATIDGDLEAYGFAVLRAALSLYEKSAQHGTLAQRAFEKAGQAFEFLVINADPETVELDFFNVIGAASYHLGGYSAIAYSILNKPAQRHNYTPGEQALVWLILRNLDALRRHVREYVSNSSTSDTSIAEALADESLSLDDAVSTIVNVSICRGLAYFDFALETGRESLFDVATNILRNALTLAGDYGNVPLWWVTRICLNLIDDLWRHSLHRVIPITPPTGVTADYWETRELFITTLYGRKIAEVELWPSQLEAARRSIDLQDDLVVALPTSAGKTRIAELATMATLTTGKRVVIVTPLRALSAQTERSFRQTFTPLGYTVSSLYGASGASDFDQNALRSRNVVIATPEKLDFAIRNDASLLDDVGLIILDEGHMIGDGEREIRYEVLVQGLLKRQDANTRRIVCLSAILPDGPNLDDFTSWLRGDEPGRAVKSKWRPTRQRFGTIKQVGGSVRLNFDYRRNEPYINRFLPNAPGGKGRELALFSAWEFAKQDKKTLIFITQANWVEGYGTAAVKLVENGELPPLIEDPSKISRALEIGREWLGSEHPAVKALEIGIGIHHGKLPNPFLREVEMLLSTGVIKVTAASPTLSQGLNINAAVLLMPYLVRNGKVISGVEFANVVGRAGRAFVDVEGLVLHVIKEEPEKRERQWRELVDTSREHMLTSGLVLVLNEAIAKLSSHGMLSQEDAYEYLANQQEAWSPNEADETEKQSMESVLDKLDNIVLGLIKALDVEIDKLPVMLEEALQGSLWKRQIERSDHSLKQMHLRLLEARAKLIWTVTTPTVRKGYFAMGLGLNSGQAIDAIAPELEHLLDGADHAASIGDANALARNLMGLADKLFTISPFAPEKLDPEWETLLEQWVTGTEIEDIGASNMPFIEEAFCYRLVWALEAVRVRRLSAGWEPVSQTGAASAAIENGLPDVQMSMLIRAGLPSRKAAIIAVREGEANFNSHAEMQAWLSSVRIEKLSSKIDWPTPETAAIWKDFKQGALNQSIPRWNKQTAVQPLVSENRNEVPAGIYRVEVDKEGKTWLMTPDFQRVARFTNNLVQSQQGILHAEIVDNDIRPVVKRYGPGRWSWK